MTSRQARVERIERSPHFRGGTFHNGVPTRVMAPGQALKVAREFLTMRAQRQPPGPLPSVTLRRSDFSDPPQDDIRVCWLGHSTALVEVEGRRVLFDPIWSKRSSPTGVAGPTRFQPVPLPLDEVPDLDAVVISHDHYDHLDKSTVLRLARANPGLPFFAALGVGARLEKWGVAPERVHELDWWEEASVAGLRLVCAPARHFSGRGVFDRNRTQWASWAVLGKARRCYFGGDGGYSEGFAEIGEKLGPFDLTLLEIGAWHPNWGDIHLGPENALKAHRDLRGRLLLPIHWGTFNLALHAWDEPIATLVERAPAAGVELLVPRLGQLARVSKPPPVERWWRAE